MLVDRPTPMLLRRRPLRLQSRCRFRLNLNARSMLRLRPRLCMRVPFSPRRRWWSPASVPATSMPMLSLTFHPLVLISRYVQLLICPRVLNADWSLSQFSTDDTFGAQRQPQPQPQAQFEPMSTGYAVNQWSSASSAPSFVSPPLASAVLVAQGSTAWNFNSATPVDLNPIDDSNGYNHGYDYTYTNDTYDTYHPFDVADGSSPLDDLNGLRGLPISDTPSIPSIPSFDPDAPFELSAEPYHVQVSLGSIDSTDPMSSIAMGGLGALSSSASYGYDVSAWSYSGQTSSSGGCVEQGAAVGYTDSYY
jgi:hypothetical protein